MELESDDFYGWILFNLYNLVYRVFKLFVFIVRPNKIFTFLKVLNPLLITFVKLKFLLSVLVGNQALKQILK